jgi:hypothetical protein
MVVKSGVDFAHIYRAIQQYLSDGCAVIYSAELDSFAHILKRMRQSDFPDAEDYIQNGTLTIVDEKIVSQQKTRLNATRLADMLFFTALEARRKSGAKRVVVMCNTDLLIDKQQFAKQVEFEQTINQKFKDGKNKEQVEVICCYSPANIQNLNLEHLVPILNSHNSMIVDKDWRYIDWHPAVVLEIIFRGIEKSLDPVTANLIFKTLKLVYKIDDDTIISNPALFEQTLRKIIGNNAADTVLTSIQEQAKSQMLE